MEKNSLQVLQTEINQHATCFRNRNQHATSFTNIIHQATSLFNKITFRGRKINVKVLQTDPYAKSFTDKISARSNFHERKSARDKFHERSHFQEEKNQCTSFMKRTFKM